MTRAEFQENAEKRVLELCKERAPPIEALAYHLVGTGFKEGMKYAMKQQLSEVVSDEIAADVVEFGDALQTVEAKLRQFIEALRPVSDFDLMALITFIGQTLAVKPKGGAS